MENPRSGSANTQRKPAAQLRGFNQSDFSGWSTDAGGANTEFNSIEAANANPKLPILTKDLKPIEDPGEAINAAGVTREENSLG